jgi:predicted metal-dependent peptidase
MTSSGIRAVRPLAAAEAEAFRLARLNAAETMPYFSHALFAVRPLAAPGLGTFAVDRHWRLYMDPARLTGPAAWGPSVAGAVLLHEIAHLLRDHHGRSRALPQPLHHLAFNLAADCEINDGMIAAGAALPADVVTPAELGLPDQKLAEEYYDALTRRDPAELAGYDDGGAGCGSGAGGPAVPGELPADAVLDGRAVTGLDPAEGDLIRRQVAEAVRAYRPGKDRGSMPAGLDRWASDVLSPPVVPWPQVLRAAVRRALADQAGRTDYTYSRPSRRRIPRVIRPAMRGPSLYVTIVVDTSGSMGQEDLDAALSEVDGVLRSTGVARHQVRVLSCDAASTAPVRVRSVHDIRLTGGGGTDMRVGIAAAARTRPAPHVIIVLTDGDTPWPGKPGPARLVCAIISRDPPHDTPPWAVTVHVPVS